MTYSIFTTSGNLVDAFESREDALALLTEIVKSEPDAADDVFLVGQDEHGNVVGDAVYGSSLKTPRRRAPVSPQPTDHGSLLEASYIAAPSSGRRP
jgi:hypothetical protein